MMYKSPDGLPDDFEENARALLRRVDWAGEVCRQDCWDKMVRVFSQIPGINIGTAMPVIEAMFEGLTEIVHPKLALISAAMGVYYSDCDHDLLVAYKAEFYLGILAQRSDYIAKFMSITQGK